MKKIIFLLLIFSIGFPAFSYDFEYTYEGQTLYYQFGNGQAWVAGGVFDKNGNPTSTKNNVSGDLVIPDKILRNDEWYPVTGISNGAFYNQKDLTSVQLPNTIIDITKYAFQSCTKLKSITISDAVETILDHAFWLCENLEEVTIQSSKIDISPYAFFSAGVSYVCLQNVKSINSDAFVNCKYLKKIAKPNDISLKLPEGVSVVNYSEDDVYFRANGLIFNNDQSHLICAPISFGGDYSIRTITTAIGPYAFAGCSGLTSVTIPQSVTTIGNVAFEGCSALNAVEIPSSVTEIGDSLFANCSGMKSVTIPNTIATIGSHSFSGCRSLTEVTIPESVCVIGDSAFSDCQAMAKLTLGENVETIGKSAFSGCSSVVSLNVPHSVKTLDDNAFYNCSGLTTIRLNDGITNFGNNVWGLCKAVKDVEYKAEKPVTASNTIFDPVAYDEATLHVPSGSVNTYMSAVPWNYFLEITDKAITSSIDDINDDSSTDKIDYTKPYEVYDLQGICVASSVDALEEGIYIVRQGNYTAKILK
ncbi:MAG: leucine-rich repeat domain-containing protein [Paramuribaculum sp.]|nr:leucine-rich repeat domain-containing protein [Paramuribaculum sp.]